MVKIQKILFPIDLTDNSSKVIPYVLSLSEKYGSEICLLHVVEDFAKWGGGIYIPHIPLEQYREDALKGAEKALSKVCEEQLQGCRNFQKKIAYGDPAQEILNAIESEDIDVVVMGTHGRKGLEHVIFGSVARKVVRRSSVPVFTVNPYKVK
ncbi:MAG: universal stress protein [Deltaproteobacteria bacterium]|nr:universal stress protein [Deltaproteobacteria bacterium]